MSSRPDIRSVDFILYTGDTARHDRDIKQPRTVKQMYKDHTKAVDYFSKTFKGIKIFVTIGNNDPGTRCSDFCLYVYIK
jgi:hypothetical protein